MKRKKNAEYIVKFHKSFCGNRWKSSVTQLAKNTICVCECVCNLPLLSLSQIALKRWQQSVSAVRHDFSELSPIVCVCVDVCHLATRL